jgi:hypothetical protein
VGEVLPRCKHARLQSGYERIELVESLSAGRAIDAYCLLCDVAWPIGAQERFLIARAIIPDNPVARVLNNPHPWACSLTRTLSTISGR